MKALADIRKDYTKASLDVTTINADPIVQFEAWFNEALKAEVLEPNAMTLSTVNAQGRPSSRIVLLKGIHQSKFVFYTNYQSDKGKDLEINHACSLLFFWPELERQVRIEGTAERVDAATSDEYFQSRPRASQIGAWSSPQSTAIQSREILEQRVKEIEKRFHGLEVLPRPHQWGGYVVTPLRMEFWQGRASRLHDRILFSPSGETWSINRLSP